MDPFANEPTELENADDIALADRMKEGRQQILAELRKKIIGQQEVMDETLLTLFVVPALFTVVWRISGRA